MHQFLVGTDDLRRQVRELRVALRAAQQAAEAERRRADAADESARRAWAVSMTARQRAD